MRLRGIAVLLPLLIWGCGDAGMEESGPETSQAKGVQLKFETPAALEVPASKQVSSDDDWEAKAHNKEIEVLQVLNIINPVAAFIQAGFEQYGERFSPTLHEEWEDTQAQLTKALKLYESCKERKGNGNFDKKLFLDLEEVWQLLVKTGVAGVRTKSMVESELQRITA